MVGGGVIGCAVAERLSRDSRHQVVLVERDTLGAHASGAAAGLLAPYSEADVGPADFGTRSFAMFPELVDRVERSGIAVEYRAGETITPALTADEERRLRQGSWRWLSPEEARAEEPTLSGTLRGAVIRDEAQVTPRRLVLGLARTAVGLGAEIREGWPVAQLLVRSGRVSGVQGLEGPLPADVVVLAAGPWAAALAAPIGLALDVRPRRGQLVLLHPRQAVLRRVLTWRGCYLVPKPDGSVVAGTTEEEVGFDARPTAAGIAGLLEFASRAVPPLGEATVISAWAALRPSTSDGKPLVGPAPGVPGLMLAVGHNRSGILLAPVTAELVTEEIARA